MTAGIASRLAAAAFYLSTAGCASLHGEPGRVLLSSCEVSDRLDGVYRPAAQPLEEVVTSSERGEIYHRDEAGDLVAVSLSDGKELWRRTPGPVPWWLGGDRLFALGAGDERGRAFMEALDVTRDGATLERSPPLEFPSGVRPDSAASGTSFRTSIRRAAGIATVAWWASRRVVRGVRGQPGVVGEPEHTSGRFTVDEETLGVAVACPEVADERPGAGGGVSERYWTGHSWETRPFQVTEGLFSLRAGANGEAGLYLVRHGSAEESIDRLTGDAGVWRRISGDGRLILIRTEASGAWRVVPVISPDAAVEIELTDNLLDAERVGGTLVALVESAGSPFGDAHRGTLPRALAAFDAATGEPRWRIATRARQILPVEN